MVIYTPIWYALFELSLTGWFNILYKQKVLLTWQNALVLAVIVFAVSAALFVLQGFGLYRMAKKAKLDRAYLAFVPFAHTLLIEQLAGEVKFFGHRVRHLGLYTMIVEIVSMVYHVFLSYALYVLFVKNGALYEVQQVEYEGLMIDLPAWNGLTGSAVGWFSFYNLAPLHSLLSLVEAILLIMLYIGFYKRYAYKNAVFFSICGIVVPFFNEITTFCIRKRNKIDYEAVLRARREAFLRQQQQWQGGQQGPYGPYRNPYGNPYSTPQNPDPQSQPKQEEPFAEFSEEPFEEFSGSASTDKSDGKDEYFN